ncbi:unnamed protein product [Parajaminaea phylloscopi]
MLRAARALAGVPRPHARFNASRARPLPTDLLGLGPISVILARSRIPTHGQPSSCAYRTYGTSNRPLIREARTRLPNAMSVVVALAALVGSGYFMASSGISAEAAVADPPSRVTPVAAGDPKDKLISMAEVASHDSLEKGVWVVIQGEVYDLTEFVEMHPGGRNIILKNAGKDVTDLYMPVHPSDAIKNNLKAEQHIGLVDPKTVEVVQKQESETDRRRREARENLPPVGSMLNVDDFERVAKSILSDQAWAYYSSAGDDEVTLHANRDSFGRVFFKPRVLRKVGAVDTKLQLVHGSIDSALPIYISPAAMAKLGHPDGEINLTRGAAATGIVQGISANASVSLDEMLDARDPPDQPLIYQLYVNRDRPTSERLLKKIEERGCNAVMLTVDAPVMGKRERDMRAKGEVVETGGGHGGAHGGGVAQAISGYIDPDVSWEDIAWYRKHCKLPLILKGIQTVEDVELAAKHGVEVVILSNHGGRSLDFTRPAFDVLIELRQSAPHLFEKVEVWMDGGVRRGTDVVKAVAVGAKAVGLGRTFLYAQSGFGQAGVQRAVGIMRDEIERAMRLLGVTRLEELTPEMVEILPRVYASTSWPQRSDDSGDTR